MILLRSLSTDKSLSLTSFGPCSQMRFYRVIFLRGEISKRNFGVIYRGIIFEHFTFWVLLAFLIFFYPFRHFHRCFFAFQPVSMPFPSTTHHVWPFSPPVFPMNVRHRAHFSVSHPPDDQVIWAWASTVPFVAFLVWQFFPFWPGPNKAKHKHLNFLSIIFIG